jgi:hypothetical protein
MLDDPEHTHHGYPMTLGTGEFPAFQDSRPFHPVRQVIRANDRLAPPRVCGLPNDEGRHNQPTLESAGSVERNHVEVDRQRKNY